MRVFRLVDEVYADIAFSGEGARLYGGRWNSPGTILVYTASSLSLAQLELLVHLGAEDVLLRHWVYMAVDVDPVHILAVDDFAGLPEDYAEWPAPESSKRIGDRWVAEQPSVGLCVPSVLTPGELNLLLNPQHPDYARSALVGDPQTLTFDRRLVKT